LLPGWSDSTYGPGTSLKPPLRRNGLPLNESALFEANLRLGGAVVEECLRHGKELLTRLLQQGTRDGEFDLRRSSASPADLAHIIVSFAQNSLLDQHHTPLSYKKGLRKTINFILDSIRA
jgi:hypothetical protein